MFKRLLTLLGLIAAIAAAATTALTVTASAEKRSVAVRMADGTIKYFVVDAPDSASLQDLRSLVPGEPISSQPVAEKTTPEPPQTTSTPAPAPAQTPAQTPTTAPAAPSAPSTTSISPMAPKIPAQSTNPQVGDLTPGTTPSKRDRRAAQAQAQSQLEGELEADPQAEGQTKKRKHRDAVNNPRSVPKAPTKTPGGAPTAANPTFMDALPGPSTATGVPNFVINKFRVPVFLLPIYQAAGIQYGVRWEVLAAINEIETDYGRNLNVSSAGALGWMQFMPATWRQYGVDANKDRRKDPFNPVDAIFAAARYLKAAGYSKSPRRAVFAYNHADWYVDSVMLRAKLIAGVPSDLVGSLTGLTEGRFPVAAHARYADDLQAARSKKVKAGANAANVVESDAKRRSIDIFAKRGAPVVATNDGRVVKIGRNRKLGRYVVLQDVYGNRYTYAGLGTVERTYAVPKADAGEGLMSLKATKAHRDPKPRLAASAGRQPRAVKRTARVGKLATEPSPDATDADLGRTAVKQRLFAHPSMPQSRPHGGDDQLIEMESRSGVTSYDGFAHPVRLDRRHFRLRRLRAGAQVIAGAPLGTVGSPTPGKEPHLKFAIRPAGKGAPTIDPKPILDGWKLLEATSIYRASGRNALRDSDGGYSIGQVMLLPKAALEKRVLADPRIDLYAGGREDIRSGQIDRRVLATLEYLAESGLKPTVSCLKNGHSLMTASGNVSEHSSGNAVDISAINGIPILGHQDPGGITEQTVRRLMLLQGTVQPHQIISLFDLGANTLAMGDHANHIHVGFRPRYGANSKLSQQARAVLRPGQWPALLRRLDDIQNPVVSSKPSRYATPVGRLKPLSRVGRR